MSTQEATLVNMHSPIGHRDVRTENAFGLNRIDHFALPTRDIALMERFIRELLGGARTTTPASTRWIARWVDRTISSSVLAMC